MKAAGAKDEKYQLLMRGDVQHDWLKASADGLVLSRTGAVYVFDNRALKTKLVELAHMGHFGRDSTLEHLARHCYWVGMAREVDDFVRGCHTCQAQQDAERAASGLAEAAAHPQPGVGQRPAWTSSGRSQRARAGTTSSWCSSTD